MDDRRQRGTRDTRVPPWRSGIPTSAGFIRPSCFSPGRGRLRPSADWGASRLAPLNACSSRRTSSGCPSEDHRRSQTEKPRFSPAPPASVRGIVLWRCADRRPRRLRQQEAEFRARVRSRRERLRAIVDSPAKFKRGNAKVTRVDFNRQIVFGNAVLRTRLPTRSPSGQTVFHCRNFALSRTASQTFCVS